MRRCALSVALLQELANYGEYSGAPSEQMTYNYAKTILGLMTRVKDERGKVRRSSIPYAVTEVLRTSERLRNLCCPSCASLVISGLLTHDRSETSSGSCMPRSEPRICHCGLCWSRRRSTSYVVSTLACCVGRKVFAWVRSKAVFVGNLCRPQAALISCMPIRFSGAYCRRRDCQLYRRCGHVHRHHHGSEAVCGRASRR